MKRIDLVSYKGKNAPWEYLFLSITFWSSSFLAVHQVWTSTWLKGSQLRNIRLRFPSVISQNAPLARSLSCLKTRTPTTFWLLHVSSIPMSNDQFHRSIWSWSTSTFRLQTKTISTMGRSVGLTLPNSDCPWLWYRSGLYVMSLSRGPAKSHLKNRPKSKRWPNASKNKSSKPSSDRDKGRRTLRTWPSSHELRLLCTNSLTWT